MDHRMAIIRRAAVTTPLLEKASEPLSGLTSKIIAEHQLGSGNILLCTTYAGVGDFQVNTVTLEGNAHLVFESTNAFGINKDFTLNFGTFSAAEHGSWTATDTADFWTTNHTVSFTETLDMGSLSGTRHGDAGPPGIGSPAVKTQEKVTTLLSSILPG